ncbi:hypothetical protein BD779DRAFT_1679146 [Infundibulicybe gibba]|nr:hypothetical protein BD779DRAFT_1679146 [Infundibulicybe gibba]
MEIDEELVWVKGKREDPKSSDEDETKSSGAHRPSPMDYHKAIRKLPDYVHHTLEAAAASTGWVFVLTAADARYYFGPKSPAGQTYMQAHAHEYEEGFRKPFGRFVKNIIPEEERKFFALRPNNIQSRPIDDTPTPPLSHTPDPLSNMLICSPSPTLTYFESSNASSRAPSPDTYFESSNASSHAPSPDCEPPNLSHRTSGTTDTQQDSTLDVHGLNQISPRLRGASPFQAASDPQFQLGPGSPSQSPPGLLMMPARTSPRKQALYRGKGPALNLNNLEADLDPDKSTGDFDWMQNSPLSSPLSSRTNLPWGSSVNHSNMTLSTRPPYSLTDELNDTSHPRLGPAPDNTLSSLGDFASSRQEYTMHVDTPNAMYPMSNAGQAMLSAHTLPTPQAGILSAASPLPTDMALTSRNTDANSTTNTPQNKHASRRTPNYATGTPAFDYASGNTFNHNTEGHTFSHAAKGYTFSHAAEANDLDTYSHNSANHTNTRTNSWAASSNRAHTWPQNRKRKRQSLDNPAPVPGRRSGRMSRAPRRPDETPPRKPISTTTVNPIVRRSDLYHHIFGAFGLFVRSPITSIIISMPNSTHQFHW